jgi:hypothetical protein
MKKIAVLFCVVFSFTFIARAQSVTITNADLEKYRIERQEANRQYNETYASRGLPSPQELRAQSDEQVKSMIDFSDKLKAQQLERDRMVLDAAISQQQAAAQVEAARARSEASGNTVYYPMETQTWGYGNIFGLPNIFRGTIKPRIFPPFFVNQNPYYVSGGIAWPSLGVPYQYRRY